MCWHANARVNEKTEERPSKYMGRCTALGKAHRFGLPLSIRVAIISIIFDADEGEVNIQTRRSTFNVHAHDQCCGALYWALRPPTSESCTVPAVRVLHWCYHEVLGIYDIRHKHEIPQNGRANAENGKQGASVECEIKRVSMILRRMSY